MNRRATQTTAAAVAIVLLACNAPSLAARSTGNAPDDMVGAPSDAFAGTTSEPGRSFLPPGPQMSEHLQAYGVTISQPEELTSDQLRAIYEAVTALGEMSASVILDATSESVSPGEAFQRIFGPTVLRVYPNADTVDGLNYAINCGWEGHYANGCQLTGIYPEQEFPEGAWLILLAGYPLLGETPEEGAGLVAHELAHNLTWGLGHDPTNVGGVRFVHYVGDEFAVENIDALSVQAGATDYHSQEARDAHPLWRTELTADAIASWALGRIDGPDMESIAGYVHDMMVCEVLDGPGC